MKERYTRGITRNTGQKNEGRENKDAYTLQGRKRVFTKVRTYIITSRTPEKYQPNQNQNATRKEKMNTNTPRKNQTINSYQTINNYTTPPRNGKAKRAVSPTAELPNNTQRLRTSPVDDATHLSKELIQTFDNKQREELETLLQDTAIQLQFSITGNSVTDLSGTDQTLATLQ